VAKYGAATEELTQIAMRTLGPAQQAGEIVLLQFGGFCYVAERMLLSVHLDGIDIS